MNKWIYFRLIWKMNRGFTLFSMISLGALQILILYLVTTFDTQSMLNSIVGQMPDNIKLFLNESFFNTLTLNGAAGFGYNHPMVIALMVVNAINIPVRHISRELENGALELLLAHPFKRDSLIVTLWLSGMFILALIVFAGFAGSLFAINAYHQLTSNLFFKVVQISINLWLFAGFIMTFTLFISSFGKAGGLSGSLSAAVVFLFYLLLIVSQLWDALKFTLSFNIFNYFEPSRIMVGQGNFWTDTLVFSILTMICLVGSVWFFRKRDVP